MITGAMPTGCGGRLFLALKATKESDGGKLSVAFVALANVKRGLWRVSGYPKVRGKFRHRAEATFAGRFPRIWGQREGRAGYQHIQRASPRHVAMRDGFGKRIPHEILHCNRVAVWPRTPRPFGRDRLVAGFGEGGEEGSFSSFARLLRHNSDHPELVEGGGRRRFWLTWRPLESVLEDWVIRQGLGLSES